MNSETRITARITEDMRVKGSSPGEALDNIGDIVRYTHQYSPRDYTDAVRADLDRLHREGHAELAVRNYWACDTWKGISTSWIDAGTGHLFEVQFHTPQSVAARELTYPAYQRLRDPATSDAERAAIIGRIRAAYAGEPARTAPPAERDRAQRHLAERARITRERARSFRGSSQPPAPSAHRVTYYAIVDRCSTTDSPAGVMRRVLKGQDGQRDEAFGHDLRWRHTFLLYSCERGNLDNAMHEICPDRAARLTDRIRREVTTRAS
jgi:hypothetical protein